MALRLTTVVRDVRHGHRRRHRRHRDEDRG